MQKKLHIKISVVYLLLMGLLGGPCLQDKHYLCTSSERVLPVEGWGIWGCSVRGVSEEIKSVSQTVILKPGEETLYGPHVVFDIYQMISSCHSWYHYVYLFDMKRTDFTRQYLFLHIEFPLMWRALLFTIEVHHHSACDNEVSWSSMHSETRQPAKSGPKY